eukprot:TRINITY_DN794_c0_g1_i1.p1 TRINITY_DN794_c0_g1~~TRINITY_DN794_c0_g1_i1.p1  ORF type:complete len:439 (+),score=69.10 TRINITY_DN794_c0_g1_i1:15-1331(+)
MNRVVAYAVLIVAVALCVVEGLGGGQTRNNPFSTAKSFYVNPAYQRELNSSINSCSAPSCSSQVKQTLQSMMNQPSAYWLDTMSKINGNSTFYASGILADAAKRSPPPLVVFIIYDLPNRDCHAKASNGEICCYPNADGTCNYNQGGDCSQGLATYRSKYIDPIVSLFRQYQNIVPIVAIIEPDSLPNLATNHGPHCGNSATTTAYTQGVTYAVTQLATQCPSVTLYIDAAHGGWLGWLNNLQAFVKIITQLGVTQYIRGFTDNVANYQTVGIACPSTQWCLNNQHPNDPCCADPCHLLTQWNPGNNEMNYIQALAEAFVSATGWRPKFVMDTGRNGVAGERSDCANWCNIRGAGVGLVPSAKTANETLLDAYYWLKTVGESDGCTQVLPSGTNCPRFDSMCASADSIGSRPGEPRAPQAGNWFDYQVKQLAANAHMH